MLAHLEAFALKLLSAKACLDLAVPNKVSCQASSRVILSVRESCLSFMHDVGSATARCKHWKQSAHGLRRKAFQAAVVERM